MRRFTVLVIALVLAPGLHSAVVQTRPDISIGTFPAAIVPETRPLPAEITPELRPLPVPEVPELRPLPVPEVEAVVPELVSVNPCDACFEYMNDLIAQLTDGVVSEVPVHPELELPEPEIIRPLPESVPEVSRPLPVPVEPEVEAELRPLPLPIGPEVEIAPLPIQLPSEAEAEESLVVQGIPLPEFIIR